MANDAPGMLTLRRCPVDDDFADRREVAPGCASGLRVGCQDRDLHPTGPHWREVYRLKCRCIGEAALNAAAIAEGQAHTAHAPVLRKAIDPVAGVYLGVSRYEGEICLLYTSPSPRD